MVVLLFYKFLSSPLSLSTSQRVWYESCMANKLNSYLETQTINTAALRYQHSNSEQEQEGEQESRKVTTFFRCIPFCRILAFIKALRRARKQLLGEFSNNYNSHRHLA